MSETAPKVHGPMLASARAACGRKASPIDPTWKTVTCGDCSAARRADEEAAALRGEPCAA